MEWAPVRRRSWFSHGQSCELRRVWFYFAGSRKFGGAGFRGARGNSRFVNLRRSFNRTNGSGRGILDEARPKRHIAVLAPLHRSKIELQLWPLLSWQRSGGIVEFANGVFKHTTIVPLVNHTRAGSYGDFGAGDCRADIESACTYARSVWNGPCGGGSADEIAGQ